MMASIWFDFWPSNFGPWPPHSGNSTKPWMSPKVATSLRNGPRVWIWLLFFSTLPTLNYLRKHF